MSKKTKKLSVDQYTSDNKNKDKKETINSLIELALNEPKFKKEAIQEIQKGVIGAIDELDYPSLVADIIGDYLKDTIMEEVKKAIQEQS